MQKVSHGFDLASLRAELDAEDWQDDFDNPGTEVRQVYLGSVFALTPSGKFYTPFACSNVNPCETCKGTGKIRRLKRRVEKKRAARQARTHHTAERQLRGFARRDEYGHVPTADRVASRVISAWRRAASLASGQSCPACNGVGSREAAQDEAWREAAEEALETIGCSLVSGEGDPCDLFAAEYRDAESDDESERSND